MQTKIYGKAPEDEEAVGLMLGRVILHQGQYKRITLSDKEYDKIMEDLLEMNMKELERIMKRTKDSDKVQILAEKQLTASFTVLVSALDEKVNKIKDATSVGFTPSQEKQLKKVVDNGFTTPKRDVKNMIDETFERVNKMNEEDGGI